MTDITELAQSLKVAAEKATPDQWVAFTHADSQTFSVHTPDDKRCGDVIKWAGFDGQRKAKANAEFIALANPVNVKQLVEVLEKAQHTTTEMENRIRKQNRHVCELFDDNTALRQRISELETNSSIYESAAAKHLERAEAAERESDNWRTSFDNERFRADNLKAHIDDIEPIRAAAKKLVRCKGRYHSELNYRALAALFGVNTPDLPPIDGESRTVTVKQGEVLVAVAGFTGCGKSAIAGEIEIAMKAIGVPVTWANGDSEKRMTGADWLTAIEMYKPTARIVEENIPRAAGFKVEAE